MFLFYYSTYLVSEQKTEEEKFQNGENAARSLIINKELETIEKELEDYHRKNELNALNLYLYGVILKHGNKNEMSKQMLVEALNKYPLLWSAWLQLNMMLREKEDASIVSQINAHWAKNFFLTSFYIKIQEESESITLNTQLLKSFPGSVYIQNEIAHACYLNQNFDHALELFKGLKAQDPFRYESMDLFSNILYIGEDFGELANLAFKTFETDKYRPETCCVLGNYYSLGGDHEKAVLYFKRAIKLDSNFLSAWTLMGHEFLELKNTPAAIEAYRSAVDIDPNDFRAWYGLGQAYEIHQMYNYASHYYSNAALSRPSDSGMWTAMGGCYQKMKKVEDSKGCFERAERLKDSEGIALYKLAKLYQTLNDYTKAANCFEKNLEKKTEEKCDETELVETH